MDLDTAKSIEGLVRMIDNVSDRSMLNGLSLDIAIVLAAAMRRQGLLNDLEQSTIEQSFANTIEDWPEDRAVKARALLDATKRIWDASTAG